jgi:adenylate cyclase
MLLPIVAGCVLAVSNISFVEQLRNLVFDNYQWLDPRPWRPDLPVRVIDIDDESLARLGQWPWPRDRLAEIARRLNELGAAAIGFDITFSEPDRASPHSVVEALEPSPERSALLAKLPSSDDQFALAITPVRAVLAVVLNNRSGADAFEAKCGFARAGDDASLFAPLFSRVILPLPPLAAAAQGLGAINFMPDRDLVLRKVPLVFALGQSPGASMLVPSLDAELLRVAQGASTIIVKSSNASGEFGFGRNTGIVAVKIGALEIPTERDGSVRIRFAGYQPGRRIPAWKLLAGEVGEAEIANRIVLVGASAAALSDLRSTPIQGAVPGDEIHAELLEHVLTGQHLARPDYAPGFEALAVAIGGLLIGLAARYIPPLPAAVLALVVVGGAWGASFWAYHRLDLLFDPLVPGTSWLLAYGLTTVSLYRRTDRERRFVRNAFSRYLSPAMVERLAADPSRLRLGGESRNVTVLFADARGFTRRSQGRSAESVVAFLNRLHTPLTAAVLAEAGTIDKYLGDGLMAFWNAPLDVPGHADRACRAALAMQTAVAQVDRAERDVAAAESRRHVPVRIGIGLNTGDAFVGNMGSEIQFNYSIVGDAVNVAARLETITKDLRVPIVVSEETAHAATGHRFVDLGETSLKGRSGAHRVYALHGPVDDDEDFEEFNRLHGMVLAAARERDPALAEAVDAAMAHPLGRRYRAFYLHLQRMFPASSTVAPATDGRVAGPESI